MTPRCICPRLLAMTFATCLIALSARAQVANNTALVGNVVDASGRAVVGAKVTAFNEETKVVYPGNTNGDGYYSIGFIVPGTYDVSVDSPGFVAIKKTGQTVEVDAVVRTDFKLQVGSDTTSISVTASAPPIATDDSTLGETFDTKTVDSLPLLGHNALEAAATASNVTIGPSSSYYGVPPGEDFVGAGQREIQNSLNLDGVTIMNSLISLAPARPSTDMIAEVQMQSGNYSAQYGSYLGLHINLVSKSGTDNLHGAAYDYVQNTALNAAYFQPGAGNKAQNQNYNQYGFDVGGPVYIPKVYNGRNKTFFFASWEKIRAVQQLNSGQVSTLTPAMEAGDFSSLLSDANGNLQLYDPLTPAHEAYPNNQIPASELATPSAAVAKKLEQYFPAPNVTNPGVQNNYSVNYPNNLYVTQTLERIDENIGQNVKIFFRYHWQNLTALAGSAFPANNTYGPTYQRNSTLGYTQIITPNLINDFRIGLNTVSTDSLDYWAENGLTDAGTSLGIPGFIADTQYHSPGIPSFYFDHYATGELGNSSANWNQGDRALDGYDQVSFVHGKHQIMAGLELRRMTINREAVNDSRGAITFSGTAYNPAAPDQTISTGYDAADFVLGVGNNSQSPVFPTNGSVGEWRDGFFVLDNWRPIEKLTINYGLRYELPTVPYSLNGYARILNADETALIPTSSAALAANFTPVKGFKFENPTHKDWAPRLGLNYRLSDAMVIRSGFGIYYNANQLNTYTLTTQNFPLSSTVSYNTAPIGNANGQADLLTLSNPTPGSGSVSSTAGIPGTYVNAVTMGPYLPTQTLYQWNLSVGRALWQGAGFDLEYLGSHGSHLDRDFYDNSPAPGAGSINSRRPNQLFGRIRRIQNDESANYHALTAILRQREKHGLSGTLSYTWSHDLNITDNSNSNVGNTMNQYDIKLDYGPSDWDIRNRFVGVVSYSLPKFQNMNLGLREVAGGWQANAIVTVQSGEPYNVNLNFDNANVSQPRGQTQRPNWIHKPSAKCGLKDWINLAGGAATSCIDTTAFAIPAQYTFGTSHRNPLYGPGYGALDFSMFKSFAIKEDVKFEFRAEARNLLNHPVAGNPNATISSSYSPNNPAGDGAQGFGTVTGTSTFYQPRQLQLSGKFVF